VWDGISERLVPVLKQPGHIPLLVGCDCSVVVGTTQALMQSGADNIHVLYVDGDFDNAVPVSEKSQSAASVALWLLTHPSPFWSGPALPSSQVTVLANSKPSQDGNSGLRSLSLADVRRVGALEADRRALAALPRSASIILHLDIDVLQGSQLPSAYFPHAEGLTLSEVGSLFNGLIKDPRVRIVEVSEYASLRDADRKYARQIADLLATGLR
jgi:arginase